MKPERTERRVADRQRGLKFDAGYLDGRRHRIYAGGPKTDDDDYMRGYALGGITLHAREIAEDTSCESCAL